MEKAGQRFRTSGGRPSAWSAGAETIVYDRGLLLAGLVWEKSIVLAEIYDRLRPSEQGASTNIELASLDFPLV